MYFQSCAHHPKQKPISPLLIDNVKVNRLDNTKFLLVIINTSLIWDDYIQLLAVRLVKTLVSLQRNIPNTTLILLYYTLIQPYLEFIVMLFCQLLPLSVLLLLAYLVNKKRQFELFHSLSGLSILHSFLQDFAF